MKYTTFYNLIKGINCLRVQLSIDNFKLLDSLLWLDIKTPIGFKHCYFHVLDRSTNQILTNQRSSNSGSMLINAPHQLGAIHNDRFVMYVTFDKIEDVQQAKVESQTSDKKVYLSQEDINEAINTFEEASRVLNNITADFITPEVMMDLRDNVDKAWKILSQAQDDQLYKEERDKAWKEYDDRKLRNEIAMGRYGC